MRTQYSVLITQYSVLSTQLFQFASESLEAAPMMSQGDVVSYLEMCADLGVSLRRGMNFRLR